RTQDQEGSWSEWTSWTPCSRTCGGGVSAQMRHCSTLRASRATTGCVGLYKRYHMCNTQECPAGSPDFRQAQCESYNGKQFMGRYYLWEAYWDGENPCELNC
ncbi:hypothetical protein DAPPUDRAFT_15798, partial [Daphnia pulex]